MKKYVFLHYGFETPTPEIMSAWGKWFESIADRTVDQGGHFTGGREISRAGTKDLPLGMDSTSTMATKSTSRCSATRRRTKSQGSKLTSRKGRENRNAEGRSWIARVSQRFVCVVCIVCRQTIQTLPTSFRLPRLLMRLLTGKKGARHPPGGRAVITSVLPPAP